MQLQPGHAMLIRAGEQKLWRYWDVHFQIDYDSSEETFSNRLEALINESISLHLRADVDVGAYVSGGVDSSLIGILANRETRQNIPFFHGRFLEDIAYDESEYARSAADACGSPLHALDIEVNDFIDNIHNIIYHLDFPVAGPGVFPQYMVSQMASESVKVVLGGQGGDEIFGGYARYVIAYFEQCMKAAIEGTYNNGDFVVTAESIIPNLEVLKAYKPLMQSFWRQGMFDSLEKRYFALVNRGIDLTDEVQLTPAEQEHVYQAFLRVYNVAKFEKAESYFDSMTHFDFKCLLPSLLHVEDRVSMAHGLEARVPFLYTPLIEFMATIPANIKFTNGNMKHLLKQTFSNVIPQKILKRKDKMGFPVPLSEWMQGGLKALVHDVFQTAANRDSNAINYDNIIAGLEKSGKFGRKEWGFLCFELWQQRFHDQCQQFKTMINTISEVA